MYDIESLGTINLGKKGESGAVIQFDLTDWLADNVGGVGTIHAIRPGETETDSYVPTGIAMNVDGTTLEWTLSAADMEIAGKGLAEVYLTDTGIVEIKPFSTMIAPAIGDTSGTLSDPRLMTTAGDMVYQTTVAARLAIGTSGQVLASSGTAPAWTSLSALNVAADVTAWAAWTPTLTWTTGTPASVTTVARWMRINKTVFFNFYTSSADANGATVLTISLPVAPKANSSFIPLQALQLQNTTWTNPEAYVDDSASLIAFYGFTTGTDNQAIKIIVSGQYEIA